MPERPQAIFPMPEGAYCHCPKHAGLIAIACVLHGVALPIPAAELQVARHVSLRPRPPFQHSQGCGITVGLARSGSLATRRYRYIANLKNPCIHGERPTLKLSLWCRCHGKDSLPTIANLASKLPTTLIVELARPAVHSGLSRGHAERL